MGEFADAAVRFAGLSGLLWGWRPDEFWRATPAELAAVVRAMRGEGPAPPLSSDQLHELRKRFPDG